ncbi:hypothetical protein SRHO_G00114350 [Serrasalmus rhombeus]
MVSLIQCTKCCLFLFYFVTCYSSPCSAASHIFISAHDFIGIYYIYVCIYLHCDLTVSGPDSGSSSRSLASKSSIPQTTSYASTEILCFSISFFLLSFVFVCLFVCH